jgi:hypothetical protein
MKYGALPAVPEVGSKIGLALDTLGKMPINGLRHQEENGTNGWYIWCGEAMSDSPDFFSPMHVEHIGDYLALAERYLALPPGYRFQIDEDGYEDVWFDKDLLQA